jgi:hypothetical protein
MNYTLVLNLYLSETCPLLVRDFQVQLYDNLRSISQDSAREINIYMLRDRLHLPRRSYILHILVFFLSNIIRMQSSRDLVIEFILHIWSIQGDYDGTRPECNR